MPDRRRALIVGIDDYPGDPLHGCVNDAREVARLLTHHHDGSPNFDVSLVTAPEGHVTRPYLKEQIQDLFARPDADIALLYFSGHGTENDLGGYLVTQDARAYDEGVALTDVLTWANDSPATERLIFLDSCMSGALGTVPATGSSSVNLQEGVSILTASRSNQLSYEVNGRGVFTELVCGALDGGAVDVRGEVTASSIYTYVEEALGPWEQRPLFKAHLSTMAPIRRAQPLVPLETLRRLTQWFGQPDSVFALDPSYEYTTEVADPEHVASFKELQRCRDARLVEAVDAEFMYFAAMDSTGCRLTPLGQRYWRLVDAGRL